MNRKDSENKLINNTPKDFKKIVQKSLNLAKKEFKDKKRPEGDKYISHSLDTALRLQREGFDTTTVICSLLHHINLTDQNLKYIEKNISPIVKDLLIVYSKIDKVVKNTDASYDIATRYILNSVEDLRPVIVQIFNAQSNSHILESIENNKDRKDIIQRNLNIHSTLAEYLGFDDIKTDITEEAFRITQREDYEYIEKLYQKEEINQEKLEEYKTYITKLIKDLDKDFEIEGRIKSKYSTFNKLKKYLKEGYINPINRISDLIGFRLITNNQEDCFKILDAIWEKGEIVIEKYDDYISHPKPNGYKAMQGPVIFPEIDDMMIEIQILTKEMYEYNTYGPASHIAYKESKSRFAKPSTKYGWIKEVHEAIKNNRKISQKEFSVPIEVKIFPDEIYALTPKGRIIGLEKGDTVTDFAYRIHTDIGNSMIGAKVNNKSTSFDQALKTGDIVEILIQKGKTHPKPNLLRCANSDTTKVKIERAMK
jgi:GTP pyrophosphokinase